MNTGIEATIADVVKSAVRSELERCLGLAERRQCVDEKTVPDKLLWSEREAADLCGISSLWLKKLRLDGRVPCHRPKKPVLYSKSDLTAIVTVLAGE